MNLKLRQAIPGRPLGDSTCPLAGVSAGGVAFVSCTPPSPPEPRRAEASRADASLAADPAQQGSKQRSSSEIPP